MVSGSELETGFLCRRDQRNQTGPAPKATRLNRALRLDDHYTRTVSRPSRSACSDPRSLITRGCIFRILSKKSRFLGQTVPKGTWCEFPNYLDARLWTCAVGLLATIVCLAHKDATTVCPPPCYTSYGIAPIFNLDLDTTAGCHSAGAQIELAAAVCLYVGKSIDRVLINNNADTSPSNGVVFNVEATDGPPSVVYESVGRSLGPSRSSRITIGDD